MFAPTPSREMTRPSKHAFSNLTGKRIGIIAPAFFGYADDFARELRERGASVLLLDERPGNSTTMKGLIRLRLPSITGAIVRAHYRSLRKALSAFEPEVVFVINPEAASVDDVQALRAQISAKFVLYMWDSVENKPRSSALFALFDAVATFDHADASSFGLHFLPLFYVPEYENARRISDPMHKKYDVCFIGTAHSDRLQLVNAFRRLCEDRGAETFNFFYLQSRALYLVRWLSDPRFRGCRISDVSFTALPRTGVVSVFANSKAVLDVNHPNQRGLTSRTFEALGAGCKLITTNSDVVGYPFYSPACVQVVDRVTPRVDFDWLSDRSDRGTVTDAIREYRLDRWSDALLYLAWC